jgi:NADH:ubiquinone oxidoreductase subunit H
MVKCYVLTCGRSVTAFSAPPRSQRPRQMPRSPHPKAGPARTVHPAVSHYTDWATGPLSFYITIINNFPFTATWEVFLIDSHLICTLNLKTTDESLTDLIKRVVRCITDQSVLTSQLLRTLSCHLVLVSSTNHSHSKFKRLLQCVRKVAVHLGYGTYIWLSVPKLPLQCAVVSLYSVVKQQLKCNAGKVCHCLIQFLPTVVLSIEERVL